MFNRTVQVTNSFELKMGIRKQLKKTSGWKYNKEFQEYNNLQEVSNSFQTTDNSIRTKNSSLVNKRIHTHIGQKG